MMQKRFYVNLNTLLRQLFFLTKKGKTVDEAIELLEHQSGLQKEIDSVKSLFSDAQELLRLPFRFGYIALLGRVLSAVKKGGGNVGHCYKAFYEGFVQNPHRIKLDMKDSIGLLIYIGAITIVSAISVIIYLIFVLPQFQVMFANAGHELPALTQFVLTTGYEFSGLFLSVVMVVIILVFILFQQMFVNVNSLNYFSHRFIKIWYLGEIFKGFNVYLSFNILLLLIRSGLSKKDSLDALDHISGNKSCIDTVALKKGEIMNSYCIEYSLSIASSLGTFEDELIHLVNEHQFVDAEKLNDLKTSVFILFICFAVSVFGTILIAMYLPIFQIGKIIS